MFIFIIKILFLVSLLGMAVIILTKTDKLRNLNLTESKPSLLAILSSSSGEVKKASSGTKDFIKEESLKFKKSLKGRFKKKKKIDLSKDYWEKIRRE